MKGEKRNSDRQMNFAIFEIEVKKIIEIINQEIGIFEIAKQQQIKDNGNCNKKITSLLYCNAEKIIGKNRNQQKRDIMWFAPGIENQARNQQNEIFIIFLRQQKIQKNHQRQKSKKKNI